VFIGLIGLCTPRVARAEEPTRAAVQYRPDVYPDSAARTNTLLAGTAVLVGGYAVGLGTSFLWSDAPTAQKLRLPVVGPIFAIANVGCGSAERSCDTVTLVVRSVLAGISGVGQVGGIGVLLEGLFMPTRAATAASINPRLNASSGASPTPAFDASVARRSPGAEITYASPSVLADGFGFSLGGRF
jgi:hypothetical protein